MEYKVEVKSKVYHEYKLISDYFVFDENDIDLHKIKKCFNLYSEELNLKEEDRNNIEKSFKEFLLFFEHNDFCFFSFPYLKNSLMGFLNSFNKKYENSFYSKCYLYFLFLANKNVFKIGLKNFYLNIIKNNYFGISPQFESAINTQVKKSDEYNKFINYLSDWYIKSELIIFYSTILSQNFGVFLDFDEKKYSLEKNFDFSIKLFAKKNFLKLASYVFKKTSINIQLNDINYDKLILLVISTFTCGISLKEIFMAGDMKKVGYIVGAFCFNFLIGKLADKIDNYTNFLEFSRLEKIILKLNKKLGKIHTKVYEILKLVMLTKLDVKYNEEKLKGGNVDSYIYPNLEEKIDDLMKVIKKYFDGVENIDEGTEKEIIESSIFNGEEAIQNTEMGADLRSSFIDICKK